MIRPRSIRVGDKIGIVGTGKKISRDGLVPATTILTSWGLRVELASHLVTDEHSYFSSSDDHRRDDLQIMIDDPEIKAILCARGGYGTTRILDDLDFSALRENPKWIVGFSDVTALHLKLLTFGIMSIHGTMPIFFSKETAATSIQSLKNALFEKGYSLSTHSSDYNRHGVAEGMAIGGNLSLIVDSLATSSEPDFRGCILIIEEVDEYLYKIDRLLTHLKRAGKLDHLHGLVIGHINGIQDTTPAFGESIEEIVLDKVKGKSFPVAFNFPSGHDDPNLAWHHGSMLKLTVNNIGMTLEALLSNS
ncbi:MAG TPA: LD-carboxypeptidase [Chryseolinea sp.]|nr:LD-carboxypeptidase [Chryseolinea sp.]